MAQIESSFMFSSVENVNIFWFQKYKTHLYGHGGAGLVKLSDECNSGSVDTWMAFHPDECPYDDA